MTGTVKKFERAFGFIEADDGSKVFVHWQDLNMGGYRSLREGDRVSFTMVEGPKGFKALNVVRIED